MDAVIKLRPEELDNRMLVKIKELIGGRMDIEVTISLTDNKTQYLKTLDLSIADLNADKGTITFTIEEFLAYPSKSL
jgi:hypothetical protein